MRYLAPSLSRALRATIACALVLVQSGMTAGDACVDDHSGASASHQVAPAEGHGTGHEAHAAVTEPACAAESANPCAPAPDGSGQCRTMIACGAPALGGHQPPSAWREAAEGMPSVASGMLESASRSPEPPPPRA